MTSPTDLLSYQGILTSVQQTFDIGLNEQNYKGGAFRGLFNASSPPLEVLNTLIASKIVTEEEKTKAFRPWRRGLIEFLKLEKKDTSGMEPLEMIMPMFGMMDWFEVFGDDLRSRGEYAPPMLMQTIGSDGSVEQTHEVDKDGNRKTTQGGRLGEVPGAPKDFNDRQAKYMDDIGLKKDAQGMKQAFTKLHA